MEITNNCTVQPQFKATLITSGVKQNRGRWSRIGKIFSEKTKNMPNDKFILGYSKEDVRPFFFFTLDKPDNRLDMMCVSNLGNWFLENSNTTIAETLTKLFMGMKIKQQAMRDCIKTRRRDITTKKQPYNDLRDIEDNYVKKIVSLLKDDIELLKIFGYTEEYGNDGILMDFRRDYANKKNCA